MIEVSQATVTFALGTLGSVLGVMNTWRAINKDKVKLKVVPKSVKPIGNADPEINICIEVLNISSFPVTIEETGFVLSGTKMRMAIINPITINNSNPPFKLDPRSSITVYGKLYDSKICDIKSAYARTSCGIEKRGTTPALKDFITRNS